MRPFAIALAAVMLATASRSWSGDDDKEARAFLDKAIRAHGGEANLSKVKALYFKGTGVARVGGDFKINGEWYLMGSTHSKVTIDVDINGMNIRIIKVLSGDKGWQKIGDAATAALNDDDLAEEKAIVYGQHVTTLMPLKDKGVKLASLGEIKSGEQTLVGMRVTRDTQRDVSLYFDKNTHLLSKVEMAVKDGGQEIVQEVLYSDYKAVDGVQLAHRVEFKRDGKAFVEADFTEVRPHTQKLDDSIFIMP
jgi:hypothetical protein